MARRAHRANLAAFALTDHDTTAGVADSLSIYRLYWVIEGLSDNNIYEFYPGGAEFFGGLALVAGVLVRPAALSLAVAMLVAIFGVHIGNGLFMASNGYEYALSLLAVSAALMASGGGRGSVDRLLAGRLAQAHATFAGRRLVQARA